MKKITPALFKKLANEVLVDDADKTGVEWVGVIVQENTFNNGRYYKALTLFLYNYNEVQVRVTYTQQEVDVHLIARDTSFRTLIEWGPVDLNELAHALTLAAKIADRVALEKGSA